MYPANRFEWVSNNLNTHRAHAVWQAFNARHGKLIKRLKMNSPLVARLIELGCNRYGAAFRSHRVVGIAARNRFARGVGRCRCRARPICNWIINHAIYGMFY